MIKTKFKILFLMLAAVGLTACGGGDSGKGTSGSGGATVFSPSEDGVLNLNLNREDLTFAAKISVKPSFQLAPANLDAPIPGLTGSNTAPQKTLILSSITSVPGKQLSVETILAAKSLVAPAATNGSVVKNKFVTTYTPSQIRGAYEMSKVPSGPLTEIQKAKLGAGQTIYIISAFHNANVAAELKAFNNAFDLPQCKSTVIAVDAVLPLASASRTECELSIVYAARGGMTSQAPAYDASWATESALDVQWAHATAPLARIVLIEAKESSVNLMIEAVALANSMGKGIVSMSFSTQEKPWTSLVDMNFNQDGMTYLAATGDNGQEVGWPAVSQYVLAVSGTTLSYDGVSKRSEVTWSGTGGGVSEYVAAPAYQSSSIPGMGSFSKRSVADVAFNADPSTGQYIAVIPEGSSSVSWFSAGGTSLSTPQWAGVMAVANAVRSLSGGSSIGQPHSLIYGGIASVAENYLSAFADITTGSDGTCFTCTAKLGYDQVTGLGTPNIEALITALSANNPVVIPTTLQFRTREALSFSANVIANNPVSYALTGAPLGMTVSNAGVISWALPVKGNYAVTLTVTDTTNGRIGSGIISITIYASGPLISALPVSGGAALPITLPIEFYDDYSSTLSVQISGIPQGMNFSVSRFSVLANWPNPVSGNYNIKIVAVNSVGATSQKTISIIIN